MIQTPASRTLAKLLVLAAALAVAIGCFVAVPRSAFAGSPAPAGMVYVNGKSGSNQASWPSGASYNESTGTLTLNNCTSLKSIRVSGAQARDLTISLSGTNVMNNALYEPGTIVGIDNQTGGSTTFNGTGSLSVQIGYYGPKIGFVYGIKCSGDINFYGQSKVVFNVVSSRGDMVDCYAVDVFGDVNVAHSAKLDIVPEQGSSYRAGGGIRFENADAKFNITTTSEVTINCGDYIEYAVVWSGGAEATGFSIANCPKVTLQSYWPFGYQRDPIQVVGYKVQNDRIAAGIYRYTYTKDASGSSDISLCTYNGNGTSFGYTGRPQRTEPAQVFMGTTKLTFGTDYYLAYSNSNSTDCGTYLAFIVGRGNYNGMKAIEYTISPRNISVPLPSTNIEFNEPVMLVKGSAKPRPTVTMDFGAGGILDLQEGSDYTLSYSNNTSVTSNAKLTVTGVGNFTGSKTVTFSTGKGFTRLYGETALDTMAAVAQQGWADNCGGTVIIATNKSYYDALAAAPLAGAVDAPILLTRPGELSDQTRAEIKRINPSRIFVMGGPAAVSDAVIEDITKLTSSDSIYIERVWGQTAIETAEAAEQGVWDYGLGINSLCVVATCKSYHDALAVAPVAYACSCPIFLTNARGELKDSTLQAIVDGEYTGVIVVGGPAVIPQATRDQLAALPNIQGNLVELYGDTAIETSYQIANWAITSYGLSPDGVGIATSQGFHDALAGAALCGKDRGVLVLVPGKSANPNYYAINQIVCGHDGYSAYGNLDYGYIFGGPAAITPEIEAYANDGMSAHG